jgi:hypothetical protein
MSDEYHPQYSSDASSESDGEWWDGAQTRRTTVASAASRLSQASVNPEESPRLRVGTTLHTKLSHNEVSKRRTLAARALGVSKDASRKTVAKAFRDKARVYHPDKGGDTDDFKLVNVAYKRLQNEIAG